MDSYSPLQKARLEFKPKLPKALEKIKEACFSSDHEKKTTTFSEQQIEKIFPHLIKNSLRKITYGAKNSRTPLRVGVVLSGGQAPGGHNVIIGLFDALKKLNPDSELIGFKDGPSGIVNNKNVELKRELLDAYRNQGGFDLIGSGRTKIETSKQFEAAEATARQLNLDGLVIIGGDDSNTNAAFLAEHFAAKGCKTTVVGVPKTIDGDLKNDKIEVSFGFDTACKIYSEIIGNIMRDALSAKKYYYFIKLMGRSASHIALECAFQTHPNFTVISEEVAEEKKSLTALVEEICELICERAERNKDYGVILIPEGVIEFIPEFKQLIRELNVLLTSDQPYGKHMEELPSSDEKVAYISKHLSNVSKECLLAIPKEIQTQLLIGRDPHGNVQVSKIETERLFIEMVAKELNRKAKIGEYKGKFSAQPIFCGYEGRAGLPSNFDSQYCYALGQVAALLIDSKASGYMAGIKNLADSVENWIPLGVPLTEMMHIEERAGESKPVIKKALVDIAGKPYKLFKQKRNAWRFDDNYICPGPIQFFGSPDLTDSVSLTLALETQKG